MSHPACHSCLICPAVQQAISGFAPPASWQQGPSHPKAAWTAATSVASAESSCATLRAAPHLFTPQQAQSALAASAPAARAAALPSRMPAGRRSFGCQEPLPESPWRHAQPLDPSTTPASAARAMASQAIPQASVHRLPDQADPSHWDHMRAQSLMASTAAPSAARETASWDSLLAATCEIIREGPGAMWQVGQAQPAATCKAAAAAAISNAAQGSIQPADLGHMHQGAPAGGQARQLHAVPASTTGRTTELTAASQGSCRAALQGAKYWGSVRQRRMQLQPMAALQPVTPAAQAAASQAISGVACQHFTHPESSARLDQKQSQPPAARMKAYAASESLAHPGGPWREGKLSSFCWHLQTTPISV